MSCDYEKLLKKNKNLIYGKIQQTLPVHGFSHHGLICRKIVVVTLLHHGEGPACIAMWINTTQGLSHLVAS
jgi:hypothetical protein